MRILEHFYSGWDTQFELRERLIDEIYSLIFECLQEAVSALKRGIEQGTFAAEDPFLESILMWSTIGSALRKTSDNPPTAFLGVDWETMKVALK